MNAKRLSVAAIALTAMAALLANLGGCMQGFAYLVAQFAPPEKAKPLYEPPKGKTVLVYVDSETPLSFDPIKGLLTENLNKQLLDNKLAASVVSRDHLLDVLAACPDPKISKQEIGEKAGADLVLYVAIEKFMVRENDSSPLWTGKMQVSLRWIDVRNVKKLWPTDQTEYPVPLVELPPSDDLSPTYGTVVAKALAIKTADRVAKLFYEHEVPKGGEKNAFE